MFLGFFQKNQTSPRTRVQKSDSMVANLGIIVAKRTTVAQLQVTIELAHTQRQQVGLFEFKTCLDMERYNVMHL
jgi:hypothetical protein